MKKILLIASSTLLAHKVLPLLVGDAENVVSVLVPSEVLRTKLAASGVHEVIVVPGGRGFRFRDITATRRLYQNVSFDQVICLYNNKTGYGYLNVDLYVLTIRGKERYAYNYDLLRIPLTPSVILRKVMKYLISPLWLVINTFFLLCIMVMIFIAMLAVELLAVIIRTSNK